ncbi:MAG: ROK family transcriptional regulator [Sphaerochaeta sp.]|nr:ROK family transcriptional regulator [Sphaerochaeta sp.]
MSNPRRTRLINSSRVIRQLWIEEQLSRAELAKRLELNKSSMSNIVNELMQQGIVKEQDVFDPGPKGGRKAIGLTLNKEYFHILGIEIRSDSYTALSVDLEGNVLFSETVPIGFTASTFSDSICTLIHDLCKKLARLERPLLGVGIGMSGVIDTEKQIILRSVSLDFHQSFDFGKEVASTFPFPVILENDANCGAWGEVVFQRKRKMQNFLFVLIEFWKGYDAKTGFPQPTVGIGFGFDGKIYRGSHSRSGEFKSVFNRNDQSKQQVLLDRTIHVTEDQDALRKYIQEICENLAFLINTLDIGNVFIGGDVDTLRSFMPDMLRSSLKLNSLEQSEGDCQIEFSSLGYHAVSFGGAALVLDRVLMSLEPLVEQTSESAYPLFYLNT